MLFLQRNNFSEAHCTRPRPSENHSVNPARTPKKFG